jgi:hypothetical protein
MRVEITIIWIGLAFHLSDGFLVGSFGAQKSSRSINCFTEESTKVVKEMTDTVPTNKTKTTMEKSDIVRNFRAASGTSRIYRCANTDGLGSLFEDQVPIIRADTPESIILNRSQLILDLRSPSERNDMLAQLWMFNAPGEKIEIITYDRAKVDTSQQMILSHDRCVLRIDMLSPTRLFDYLEKNWISGPIETAQYSFNYAFDSKKLHEIRMEIMNEKGLPGLYEAMIETSGPEILVALQAITIKLETKSGDIIIHCVQGKDRTGLLIMLCQAILGMNDEEIIKDYHASDRMMRREGSAASDSISGSKGKLNRNVFSGAPKEAMAKTLKKIRTNHVSINGYLDSIGFDTNWRQRFITASSLRNKL